MPPSNRENIRKQRYDYAISLGFSAAEARRFRDLSGRELEREITLERLRILRKRANRRSPQERERLERITDEQGRVPVETRQRRTFSQSERQDMFETWSEGKFPEWALERIRAYNSAKGLSRDDGFGYRRFYYWYVLRIADFENEFYADRNDSGIRHLQNVPLRSKQEVKRSA